MLHMFVLSKDGGRFGINYPSGGVTADLATSEARLDWTGLAPSACRWFFCPRRSGHLKPTCGTSTLGSYIDYLSRIRDLPSASKGLTISVNALTSRDNGMRLDSIQFLEDLSQTSSIRVAAR